MSLDDPRLTDRQLLKVEQNQLDNIYMNDMVKEIMKSTKDYR